MFSKIKSFFQREDINIGRQANIDYAKAVAIFGMVLVHIMIYPYYGCFSTKPFGYFIGYILGGFMAAPVFMTAMGIGLSYKNETDPKKTIWRGLRLILMHYVLNILRSAVGFFTIVPNAANPTQMALYCIFGGDILLFAGLALIAFGLLKLIKKHNDLIILIVAIILLIISEIFKVKEPSSFTESLLLGSFIPVNFVSEDLTDPVTVFSFCSWFIFVAVGNTLGVTIKKLKNLNRFYIILGVAGAVLTTTVLLLDYHLGLEGYFITYAETDPEYVGSLIYALAAIGVVFVEFALFHFICKITPKFLNKAIFKFSSAINEIYIISWIIILNVSAQILTPLLGDEPVIFWPYLVSFIIVFPLSTYLGLLWRNLKIKRKQKLAVKKVS